jgi:hypothetical protein
MSCENIKFAEKTMKIIYFYIFIIKKPHNVRFNDFKNGVGSLE